MATRIETAVLRVRVPSETARRIAERADEIGESPGGFLRKFLTRQFAVASDVANIDREVAKSDGDMWGQE